jgi:hypothetical protein
LIGDDRVEGDVAVRGVIPEQQEIDPDRSVYVGSRLERLRVHATSRYCDRRHDERNRPYERGDA